MREQKKRVICTMAVALALGASLAACSQKDPAAEGSPAAAASTKPEATAKPYVRGDITSSIYDRGSVPAEEGTIESNRWTKWINENGPANVKFVAIPRFESQQKLNVLFASGSAPDLIFEYDPAIKNTFYDQKLMMPLDEMIDKYSTEYKKMIQDYPELKKVGLKPDGKLYEFAKFNEVYPIYTILIRNDWLKKLNLQAPQTTEELFDLAKAFAEKDPDGNGKNDTYGINLSANATYFIKHFFQGNNWIIKDGQMVREWDNTKAAIEYQRKFLEAGLVDKDFINDKNGAKAKQDFVNGKIGIYLATSIDWRSFALNEYATLKKNVPTAELTVISSPKSSMGHFNVPLSNPIQATAFVNSKASNPEAVMKYVDFLVKPETINTLAYGLEGVHYKLGDSGCPVAIDPDKNKIEFAGKTGDLQMLSSLVLDTKCGTQYARFDQNDPNQKDMLELEKIAISLIDSKKEMSTITHVEHMPTLPKELQQIVKSTEQPLLDLYFKGILGGEKFKAEDAMKESRELWEKSGGKQVEEWYKKWYQENKDTAFLAKDILELERKQHGKK